MPSLNPGIVTTVCDVAWIGFFVAALYWAAGRVRRLPVFTAGLVALSFAAWSALNLIVLKYSPRTTVTGHVTELVLPFRTLKHSTGGTPRMYFHTNDGREIKLTLDFANEATSVFHQSQNLRLTYTNWDGRVRDVDSVTVAGDYGNDPTPDEIILAAGLLTAAVLCLAWIRRRNREAETHDLEVLRSR
jgi:hypothetical protein